MEIAKAAGEGKAPSERTEKCMNAKNYFIDDIRPVVWGSTEERQYLTWLLRKNGVYFTHATVYK